MDEENELGILEFIHALVETLDKYFENVCELDIMFNLEKAHFILDEMVTNGCIMETNKGNILKPILWLEKRVRASAACCARRPCPQQPLTHAPPLPSRSAPPLQDLQELAKARPAPTRRAGRCRALLSSPRAEAERSVLAR